MARGLPLRGLAAQLEVSPVYMSNMENDRRPAPTKENGPPYRDFGTMPGGHGTALIWPPSPKTQRVSATSRITS